MLCKYYERHNNLYWYFHHRISQVVDYDVQFKESGTQYTEKIKVDTDKQTELFKVPAHNDVDGSNILHDFKAVSLFLSYSRRHSCRRTLENKKKKKKKEWGRQWKQLANVQCSIVTCTMRCPLHDGGESFSFISHCRCYLSKEHQVHWNLWHFDQILKFRLG